MTSSPSRSPMPPEVPPAVGPQGGRSIVPIAVTMFGMCLTISLTLQARSQLILKQFKGDISKCSVLLARLTVGSTLLELMTNPSWGSLTDE